MRGTSETQAAKTQRARMLSSDVSLSRRERQAQYRALRAERRLEQIATVAHTLPETSGWFVVRTNPRCEMRAFDGLRAAGFEVWMPMRAVFIRRRYTKSKRRVEHPLLTGYLFVAMSLRYGDWLRLRSVDGVRQVLGLDGERDEAVPLRAQDFEDLRQFCKGGIFDEKRAKAHWRKQSQTLQQVYKPDDRVVVKEGPFAGMVVRFDSYSGAESAKIIVEVFGTLRPVEIALEAIQCEQ